MPHSFSSILLSWYDQNARDLPWRGFHDSYRTWISEIMLQQTRVDTVIPYYHRFLSLFPTLEALAAAPEEQVLKAWEGLGYYSRARNLQKGARQVMREYQGRLPSDPEELEKITGIGPYTAGAIASIAYDRRVPAVDGNVIRVLSRVFGIREDVTVPSVRRRLSQLAAGLVPADRPGDYNQAVMDLGATVCVPGTPDCARCPLAAGCDACAEEDADLLPVRAAAKPPVPVDVGVGLVTCGDRILMQRRDAALLRGLWVFFLMEGDASREGMQKKLRSLGLDAAYKTDLGEAQHVFTHRIWNMRLYHFEASEPIPLQDFTWVDAEQLRALPLPTAMRAAKKAAEAILNAAPCIK